jgi:flavin reductase (DIM6/NTAB) family NADH-FMN oxidoreductase RutF
VIGENKVPDIDQYRKAWSKFATGVSVIISRDDTGAVHGMAANGITSVSLDPMLVLVCVDHSRNTYKRIKETGKFSINILNHNQTAVAEYYARRPEKRIGEPPCELIFGKKGSVKIADCIAFIDCHVHEEIIQGDHTIYIGKVVDITSGGGKPLLFYESMFNELAHDGQSPNWS